MFVEEIKLERMCNSSSSSVCEEGLQSSSSVMNLKLGAPLKECPILHNNKGGWAFLQSISNKTETQKPYDVHPIPTPTQKRFCLRLEMCTENLGCENGSSDDVSVSALFPLQSKSNDMNTLSSSIIMSSSSSSPPPQSHNDERKYCSSSNSTSVSKRWKRSGTRRFPPPLSSRSEEGGVQLLIRRRREHGRLILEAVPNPSFFKAERSNGRLTLRLFTQYYSSSSTLFEQHKQLGEGEDQLQSEIESEEEDDDDDETEELDDENMNEDEMGIRKLPRPSRCYQNGNRNYRNQQLLDLEPFWVAT